MPCCVVLSISLGWNTIQAVSVFIFDVIPKAFSISLGLSTIQAVFVFISDVIPKGF